MKRRTALLLLFVLPACAPADDAQRAWACEPMRTIASDQESRVVVELDTREALPGSYVQALCVARPGAPEALVRYVVPPRAGGSGYTALTIELATRDGVDWAGAALSRTCPPSEDGALECLFGAGELTTLTHPGDTVDVLVTSNGAWEVEGGEVELAFSPRGRGDGDGPLAIPPAHAADALLRRVPRAHAGRAR